jgi:hypothetical protein
MQSIVILVVNHVNGYNLITIKMVDHDLIQS